MALIVRKTYIGKDIYNEMRIGIIERAKKTSISYTIDFYRYRPINDIIEDFKVDLKQLKYKLTGKKGRILKARPLMEFSQTMDFRTELKKMPRPKLKNNR